MGQVAIVTGGSSGIGAAAAEYLAAHGCTVYEFSRHEKSVCANVSRTSSRSAQRRLASCSFMGKLLSGWFYSAYILPRMALAAVEGSSRMRKMTSR